jgi:hypothetical protein
VKTNFDDIVEKLRSGELERQIGGIDDAKEVIAELVRKATDLLFNPLVEGSRYVVAERLFTMGPVVIADLEGRVEMSKNVVGEGNTYAALILLRLGSSKGVALLLEALRNGIGPTGMIAQSLGAAGIQAAGEVICQALARLPFDRDPYTAASMISALHDLRAPVPAAMLDELETIAPHVRRLL